ncbi:TPA: hypothetical protein ACP62B_004745 [Escherichia coli]
MSGISDVLNTDVRSTIISYQTLANKAVKTENSPDGAMAALERFFHRLEFLLMYGYPPGQIDAAGGRFPPELNGLLTFLNSGKGSYVLQKDAVTQYCFKYSNVEGKIEVIEKNLIYQEIRHCTPTMLA